MERGTKTLNLFKADKEELKPCPFCSGKEIYYRAYKHLAGKRWEVICSNCMARVDPGTAQDKWKVKEIWNKRDGKGD